MSGANVWIAWSGVERSTPAFQDHEVALVEEIADACRRDAQAQSNSPAEVMHLPSALHERYGEDRIIGQTSAIRAPRHGIGPRRGRAQTTFLKSTGESGTFSNLIHYNSGREDQPSLM